MNTRACAHPASECWHKFRDWKHAQPQNYAQALLVVRIEGAVIALLAPCYCTVIVIAPCYCTACALWAHSSMVAPHVASQGVDTLLGALKAWKHHGARRGWWCRSASAVRCLSGACTAEGAVQPTNCATAHYAAHEPVGSARALCPA